MFSFKYIKCIIKCTVCPCPIRLKAIVLSWSINQSSRLTKIYLKFISLVLYIIVNGKRDIYLQIKHQIKQCKFRPCPHVSGYFLIRNFFFRIQKFRLPHVSGFKSNLPVHTYLTRTSTFTLVPRTPLGILATEHAW